MSDDKPEENVTAETAEAPANTNATEAVEPVDQPRGLDDAPREARSVSSQSTASEKSHTFPTATSTTPTGVPVRPAPSGKRGTPRARRMNLSLTHVNAWSVAKVTFMLSIAGAIIEVLAAALVWLLLDAVGVFDQLNNIVSSTGLAADSLNLSSVFSLSTVLSVVTILAIVGVVLVTLLATIIALLYNVISALVGGIHITLGDD